MYSDEYTAEFLFTPALAAPYAIPYACNNNGASVSARRKECPVYSGEARRSPWMSRRVVRRTLDP